MSPHHKLVLALSLVVVASLADAQSGPALNAPPVSGTITLRPGFLPDPQTAAGIARGAVDANSYAPTCSGFVGAPPDHALVLRGAEPWMRIYVTSALDTTLVVRRPDGTWACSDDAFGRNPAVEGAFPAGRYLIWVGTYHAGTQAPYTLSCTELQSNHP